MATSAITNTLTDALGTALAGIRVVARLIPTPAFRTATAVEISPLTETETDASGNWSLALEETAGITPANSRYEIIEYVPGEPLIHQIQVGASNQSLYAALVAPPPAVTAATYLTQAIGDARYQELGALGGTAVDVDHSAASNGVSLAAARADHKHALANQVEVTHKTSIFSTTSTSFVDVTGLSIAITPRAATNKILITAVIPNSNSGANLNIFNLLRDATLIAQPDTGATYFGSALSPIGASTDLQHTTIQWLDSPASIVAVTYKIQCMTSAGTLYVNRRGDIADYTAVASIKAEETAA